MSLFHGFFQVPLFDWKVLYAKGDNNASLLERVVKLQKRMEAEENIRKQGEYVDGQAS
jgi:hypothetical protein